MMIECRFCGRHYDTWGSRANEFHRFCSPWCEEARTLLPFPVLEVPATRGRAS